MDIGITSRSRSSVGRGAAWLAAVGFVLGGVAGTVDWPVVGTFFGAVEGAAFGAVAGVVVGAVLAVIAARTHSRLTVRLVSAALAGGAGTVALLDGSPDMPRLRAAAVATAAAFLAACVAPSIAYGETPAPGGAYAVTGLRILAVGAIAGAGIGAAVGLIIGICAYLPTAPVAAVEGGVFGLVSGLIVAGIVAGVVLVVLVVQRWRAGR